MKPAICYGKNIGHAWIDLKKLWAELAPAMERHGWNIGPLEIEHAEECARCGLRR